MAMYGMRTQRIEELMTAAADEFAQLEQVFGFTLTDTERELLACKDTPHLLAPIERQQLYILRSWGLQPKQCPSCAMVICKRGVALAAKDPEELTPVTPRTPNSYTDASFKCNWCGARLIWWVTIVGETGFTLAPGQVIDHPIGQLKEPAGA